MTQLLTKKKDLCRRLSAVDKEERLMQGVLPFLEAFGGLLTPREYIEKCWRNETRNISAGDIMRFPEGSAYDTRD